MENVRFGLTLGHDCFQQISEEGGEHTTSTKSILKIFNRVSVRKVNSLASNLKLLNPILSSFSV